MTPHKPQTMLVREALEVYGNWTLQLGLYAIVLVTAMSLALLLDLRFAVAPAKVLMYTLPLTVALLLLLPLGYVAYRRARCAHKRQVQKTVNKQVLE
jgi:hypothetical protein